MTQKTAVFTHQACLLHNPGVDHPEKPLRLSGVLDVMKRYFPEKGHPHVEWVQADAASRSQIIEVHDEDYFEFIHESCARLKPYDPPLSLDEDTNISYGSWDAILHSVGAACHAVDAVYDGQYRNAFCVTRPPGHHVMRGSVKGFGIFGNVGIAAAHALKKTHINKVAIVDFDVHQGNGTEDLVKNDPNILFVSMHQDPLWPYLHHSDHGPHGTVHNISIPVKMPAVDYHSTFDQYVLPLLESWRPDFLIVSAGFDSHRDDPPKDNLFNDPPGRQMLLEDDFNLVTSKLMRIADRHAHGRLVSVLEGGYNIDVLANCCVEHTKTLAGLV